MWNKLISSAWCRQCHRWSLSLQWLMVLRPGVASDENTNRSESRTVLPLQFQETRCSCADNDFDPRFHTQFWHWSFFAWSICQELPGQHRREPQFHVDLVIFSCANIAPKAPEVSGPVPRRWGTQSPAGEASEPTTVRLDAKAIVASS